MKASTRSNKPDKHKANKTNKLYEQGNSGCGR